jgi:hypothetical protein
MANNSSWKNMACHEDIGMTYFIITRSIVLITIKPCRWCGISIYHLWKMLTTDLNYARALLNPYFLGEVFLHYDVDVKETLNCVLQKNTNNSTAYTQDLKDFVDFIENQGPFSGTLPPPK